MARPRFAAMRVTGATLGSGRAHNLACRGSDGADNRVPVEETGRFICFSPLTAGALLLSKPAAETLHIASNEAYGLGAVAINQITM